MILSRKIEVSVRDSEKFGFEGNQFYSVIGTKAIKYQKDGHVIQDYQLMVVNKDDEIKTVFINMCKVRLLD